ncbi:MAG: hypothetical protein KC425_16245, partial [Anaerolineales bacterium]|nr:hypothetical protein [Anaerolineales bacterium]
GVYIGATALMAGVLAEAAYATLAVRPLLRDALHPDAPAAEGDPLTYRDLALFHLPLGATSLLLLLAQPLVTSSLARLPQPTESLAAWPVLFQMMLMARAAALALPEVVIALSRGPHTFAPLRRFSLWLSVAITAFMALLIFTPLAHFYIFTVQDMTPAVGELAQGGLLLFLLFPALATVTSWLRGLLIKARATTAVNWGMGINLLLTAAVLGAGLFLRQPGLPTAAVALNLASVAEVLYLAARTQRILPTGVALWKTTPVEAV